MVADLYETVDGSDTEPTSFLKESDIQKIKTLFWAYNITNFAPKLNLHADITAGTGGDAATVPVVGTWFNTTLHLATGETSVVGVQGMRSWWTINGRLGAGRRRRGDDWRGPRRPTAHRRSGRDHHPIPGEYGGHRHRRRHLRFGRRGKRRRLCSLATLQELSGLTDSVDEVEVKALTTPETTWHAKVSRNPAAVTQEEWETWYCTA